MPDYPIDVSEIERLRLKLKSQLFELTGCVASVEIWFHESALSDTRGLAHDAVLQGWKVNRVKSVYPPSENTHICLYPRTKKGRDNA